MIWQHVLNNKEEVWKHNVFFFKLSLPTMEGVRSLVVAPLLLVYPVHQSP